MICLLHRSVVTLGRVLTCDADLQWELVSHMARHMLLAFCSSNAWDPKVQICYLAGDRSELGLHMHDRFVEMEAVPDID